MSDAAAIIADYAEGHPIKAICAEYGISRATLYRITKGAGIPERKRGPAKRPQRTCGCGSLTTAASGTCTLCRLAAKRPDPSESGPIALSGGDWVIDPRKRVMVWKPRGDRSLFPASRKLEQWSQDTDASRPRAELQLQVRGASPTERNTDRRG